VKELTIYKKAHNISNLLLHIVQKEKIAAKIAGVNRPKNVI
jgi:hypothetical protein